MFPKVKYMKKYKSFFAWTLLIVEAKRYLTQIALLSNLILHLPSVHSLYFSRMYGLPDSKMEM